LLHTLRNLTETPAMTTLIIGSPELLLRTRRLPRQSDRLFPQCVLGAMAPADTALYVRHRMLRAGGDPEIFPAAAVEIIHDLCGGIARRINRLCDLCLLVGYSKNCDAVTPGLIWMAQGEIRFLAPSRTALAAPTRRWRAFRRHSEPKMVIGDRLSGDR
jgi:general secretion pathway protein A